MQWFSTFLFGEPLPVVMDHQDRPIILYEDVTYDMLLILGRPKLCPSISENPNQGSVAHYGALSSKGCRKLFKFKKAFNMF